MLKLASCVALLLSTVAALSAGLSAEPFPSTYQVPLTPPLLVQGATVLTGTGERIEGADVFIENGRVVSVGRNLSAPAGARIVNAAGRWVTPGLIDIHSHLGVYASPGMKGLDDGNEATSPNTANVWAEQSIWPQDPGLETALEGGVTTLQILPGSANLIGGRSVVIKNVPAVTYQAMKFPAATYGLKMACGENPKRVYGEKNQAPSTRMGNVAEYRQAFADAQDYQQQWDKYQRDLTEYNKKKAQPANGAKKAGGKDGGGKEAGELTAPNPPKRDLKLETLAEVLNGHIRVKDLPSDFDHLAATLDAAARLQRAGVRIAFSSGDSHNARLTRQLAGNAVAHGMPGESALAAITANPAEILGLGATRGRIAVGQVADLVLWTGDPLEVTSMAEQVRIDGRPIEMRSRQTELRDRYIDRVKAHRAF